VNIAITKSSLSHSRRTLLETMQRYPFCQIENLAVREGEPFFEPPPSIVQEIRLGDDTWRGRPELATEDFLLRSSVLDLFAHVERIRNGTITAIEVRHGLPHKITVIFPLTLPND
jgi:hypothetical protein